MACINAPAKHHLPIHSLPLLLFMMILPSIMQLSNLHFPLFLTLFIYKHRLSHSQIALLTALWLLSLVGANMGRQRLAVALVFCIMAMSPLSMVMSRSLSELADKKNYYSPDPNAPPRHHNNPSCQTPSHGGSGGTPPTPTTPSHGGGSGGTPPSPTTPSHGGGSGYYNTPPTVPLSPNPVPTHPAPLSPLVPLVPPSPTTPNSTPPTPFIPVDPNTPPFFTGTCYFWSTHPAAISVLFGYWGTIGQVFGSPATLPFGRNLNLLEALGNTRNDGIGALLREGTASLLNSMVNTRFAFPTQQVRDSFNTAMHSEKTAAAQAKLFQKANEGHIQH